ncbi:hypothetical protein WGT02_17380 [Rhizobium sp. T1470]|uniref:hypothetical protein n=1 Tax=unclassified Rhizobium TaxID=2613769 RepID=UPI001CD5FB3D|nr:hypothetical protein [Rhizobium sp. T1473]MCA0802956.1 hypothetical protein [Rhizobium sp. T1473]
MRRTFLEVSEHLQFDFLGRYEHGQRIGPDMYGGDAVVHSICRVVSQIETGLCRGRIGQKDDNIGMLGEIANVTRSFA